MHNNYYFFRKLVPALEKKLVATRIGSCFSQNRDELVIPFESPDSIFLIKADLQATFSCLSFPNRFDRARRNAAEVFQRINDLKVRSVRLFDNERSFALTLDQAYTMLFKMHGNRSNIVLFKGLEVVDMFKKNLRQDLLIRLDTLDRSIDWTYEYFLQHQDNLTNGFFTLGKRVWSYLRAQGFDDLSQQEKWERLQEVHASLLSPKYSITETEDQLFFSLLPPARGIDTHDNPLEALSVFYTAYVRHEAFRTLSKTATGKAHAAIQTREAALEKASVRMHALKHEQNFKIWADLLMANLHAVRTGESQVVLSNFYDEGRPVAIKLNKDRTAAQNAEAYYAKSKNQAQEVTRLQKIIADSRDQLATLREQLEQLTSAEDLTTLKSLVARFDLTKQSRRSATSVPFHQYEHLGYKILVGKNSKNNDLLTTQYGYKEDLWFHVRDAAGSHVLLKHQAGRTFPKDVITYAAQLAAYYSKRKTETLCPVVYTPKKFVRKRKGDPAGMVVLEREKTLMVTPSPTPL